MARIPLTDRDRAANALSALELDITEDNIDQMVVMVEAMQIYQEREQARGGLWKDAGALDSAHHLGSKGRRVLFAAQRDNFSAAVDDAIDAVNYAVFYVRNWRAGRVAESPTKED